MFRIRFVTPESLDEQGTPRAGAELVLGAQRWRFLVDLRYWSMKGYERQWRSGVERLVRGAGSSALLTAYGGPPQGIHRMWALWRNDQDVYLQELSLLPVELETPFDPANPYAHVGDRVPVTEEGLPIPEYRQDLLSLLTAHFLPAFPWR